MAQVINHSAHMCDEDSELCDYYFLNAVLKTYTNWQKQNVHSSQTSTEKAEINDIFETEINKQLHHPAFQKDRKRRNDNRK